MNRISQLLLRQRLLQFNQIIRCSKPNSFQNLCSECGYFRQPFTQIQISKQYSAFSSLNNIKLLSKPNKCMLQRAMSSKITEKNKTTMMYLCAAGVFMIGMSYAGVPLYKMFCQATGRGGQATKGHDTSKIETMSPVTEQEIKIRFNADTHSSMQWNFRPQQTEITVVPGETALAFYTAKNPTDKPVIGISTYNVLPFEAGLYFNKIQCFCFEEQRLNPHEQVDMPVFFYIDPEFTEDPKMEFVDEITLSYTFFEAKDGLNIPLPGYMQNQPT